MYETGWLLKMTKMLGFNPIFNGLFFIRGLMGGGGKITPQADFYLAEGPPFIFFEWNLVLHVFWNSWTDTLSQNDFMELFLRVGGVFLHFSNFTFLAFSPIFGFPWCLFWLEISLCSSNTSFHTTLCMSNKKHKFLRTKLLKTLNMW